MLAWCAHVVNDSLSAQLPVLQSERRDELHYMLLCASQYDVNVVISFSLLSESALARHAIVFSEDPGSACGVFEAINQPLVHVGQKILTNHPLHTHGNISESTADVLDTMRTLNLSTNRTHALNFTEATLVQVFSYVAQVLGRDFRVEETRDQHRRSALTVVSVKRISDVELINLVEAICRLGPCNLSFNENGDIVVSVDEENAWHKIALGSRRGLNGSGQGRVVWKQWAEQRR